jgi:hypothetical protein
MPQQGGMRPNGKFINNDDTKYTLPKKQTAYVHKPTDPNLVANPMAIFGNVSGLRPTSGEAINNPNYGYQGGPRPPQQRVQPRPNNRTPQRGPRPVQRPTSQPGRPSPQQVGGQNTKCPQCGFIIKPGQPSCLVCGYKLH